MKFAIAVEIRDGTTYYRNERGSWSHSLQAHSGVADVLIFDTKDQAEKYIEAQVARAAVKGLINFGNVVRWQ